MVKLFVDDKRVPSDVYIPTYNINRIYKEADWTMITQSHDEFTKFVTCSTYLPEVISFDHDLNEEHQTFIREINSSTERPFAWIKDNIYDKMKIKSGYHCAEWLVKYCLSNYYPLPICFVHAANTQSCKNILSILDTYNLQKALMNQHHIYDEGCE